MATTMITLLKGTFFQIVFVSDKDEKLKWRIGVAEIQVNSKLEEKNELGCLLWKPFDGCGDYRWSSPHLPFKKFKKRKLALTWIMISVSLQRRRSEERGCRPSPSQENIIVTQAFEGSSKFHNPSIFSRNLDERDKKAHHLGRTNEKIPIVIEYLAFPFQKLDEFVWTSAQSWAVLCWALDFDRHSCAYILDYHWHCMCVGAQGRGHTTRTSNTHYQENAKHRTTILGLGTLSVCVRNGYKNILPSQCSFMSCFSDRKI